MSQIEFLRPSLVLLALIPPLVFFLRRRFWRRTIQHPQAARFLQSGLRKPPRWLYIPHLMEWLIIFLLVGVLIQPVLPIGKRTTIVRALDLVLCIDLSASMRKKFDAEEGTSLSVAESQLNRLDAVKQVISDFIRSRPQDRIGLVVFSANGYLVNPLTTDHQVLAEYIQLMDGNTLIGEGLTSVGEGLQVSNELLSFFGLDREKKGKAIIVFTDAEQNYGLKPDRPLEEARLNQTNVYFVGVGVPIESVLGKLTGAVRATGGNFFDASNAEDLRAASREIDRLQRNPVEITEYFRNQSLALPLLVVVWILFLVNSGLRALPTFYVTG